MGRSPCCEKVGLKKGPWTPEEDQKLLAYIEEHGHGSWRALPIKAGLLRCGKSCRLRWTNYLRPDIKRGKFSLQEEQTIIQLHALLGNRWSAIATHLPKRTDNEIKNYWNTHLKKRLAKMGIDPVTHKPKSDALASSADHEGHSNSKTAANLSHMAQWESARLEAEARLVRESKLIQAASTTNLNNEQLPAAAVQATSSSSSTAPALCLDVIKAWQATWSTRAGSTGSGVKIMPDLASLALDSPTSTLSFSPCNNGSSAAADHNNITSNNNGCKIAGLASTSFGNLEDSNVNPEEFIIDNPQKLGFLSFLNQLPIRRQPQDDEFTHDQEHQPSMSKTKYDDHGINGDSASAVFGSFHEIIFSADHVKNDNSCEFTLQSHPSVKEAILPQLDNVDGRTDNSVIKQCDNDDEPTDLDSEEENRSYWNSILNMVNASSSPERSPIF